MCKIALCHIGASPIVVGLVEIRAQSDRLTEVVDCKIEPAGLSVEAAEIQKHAGIVRGKLTGLQQIRERLFVAPLLSPDR